MKNARTAKRGIRAAGRFHYKPHPTALDSDTHLLWRFASLLGDPPGAFCGWLLWARAEPFFFEDKDT